MSIRDILSNNVLMMTFAFILGFVLGGFPALNSELAMASLVVVMSLSLGGLRLKNLDLKKHVWSTAIALVVCFGVSSGVTILLSYLFDDYMIRFGWILVAAVPSAIAVIPFTYMLKGDLEYSLVASTVIYLLALVITPLIAVAFAGYAIDQTTLLWYVAVLIFLPLVFSRGLRKIHVSGQVRTILINIAFFILFFAVTGTNREAFFGEPALVLGLLLVAAFRTFAVGGAIEFIARKRKMDRKERIPTVLFATYKNTGMAAALAVALVGNEAAIPATVCLAIEVVWFLALTKWIYPSPGR
ncbi:MAG: hypothetical protein FJ151_03640 [Euryarchaeota archaeon]|nr:hypothetical protein [Euryarchaeota archaeon]